MSIDTNTVRNMCDYGYWSYPTAHYYIPLIRYLNLFALTSPKKVLKNIITYNKKCSYTYCTKRKKKISNYKLIYTPQHVLGYFIASDFYINDYSDGYQFSFYNNLDLDLTLNEYLYNWFIIKTYYCR